MKNMKMHFIGIKGIGMSGAAIIAKGQGNIIQGSDVNQVFLSDILLSREGIKVLPFSVDNITKDLDLVVYSVAYDEKNPEFRKSKELNIPMVTYPQLVNILMENHIGIGISGCNGKSTTTAMLSYLFMENNLDPTYIVGAPLVNYETNANFGKGTAFIIEADEYKEAFLEYASQLQHLIITNIDFDHPDFYFSLDAVLNTYIKLLHKLPKDSYVYLYGDDPGIKTLLNRNTRNDLNIVTFGFNTTNDYVIKKESLGFKLIHGNSVLNIPPLPLLGTHNILNATASILVSMHFNIDYSLKNFKGIKRRCEFKSSDNGIIIIDDYAHHPTAVKLTLEGIRNKYPDRKIWCVFQPHTYTRTKALLDEFSMSFDSADVVIIPDIYASARETFTGDITSEDLVNKIRNARIEAYYIPYPSEVISFLKNEMKEGEILVTMGAGDIWKTVTEVMQKGYLKSIA